MHNDYNPDFKRYDEILNLVFNSGSLNFEFHTADDILNAVFDSGSNSFKINITNISEVLAEQSIGALSDVDLTLPIEEEQFLIFRNGQWRNITKDGQAAATRLSEMDDVNLMTLTNGQLLSYDSASLLWVNRTINSSDLSDFSVSNPQTFDFLIYSGSHWVNKSQLDYIDFNASLLSDPAFKAGRQFWDVTNNTISFYVPDSGSIQVNQEMFDYYVNADTVPLVNGDIVSISPLPGNRAAIARTDATDSMSSNSVVGMVTVPSIAVNQVGRVTKLGKVRELPTSGYLERTRLFVDPANKGKWTSTQPEAPNYIICVGIVDVSHNTQGVVDVHHETHPKFTDLSDVNGTPLDSNGQIPIWDNVRSVFDFTDNINNYAKLSNVSNTFDGNITISGNLIVNGSKIIQNTEESLIKDSTIIINSGESGAGVTSGIAGLVFDRGSLVNYGYIFDESDGLFRIGQYESLSGTTVSSTNNTIVLDSNASAVDDTYNGKIIKVFKTGIATQYRTISDYVGSTKTATISINWTSNPDNTFGYDIQEVVNNTQAIATRQDTPTDLAIPYWNNTDKRFDTNSLLTINATGQIVSTLTGAAPFIVASGALKVVNLDADKVDGIEGSNIAKLDSANIFTNNTASTFVKLRVSDNMSIGESDGTYQLAQLRSSAPVADYNAFRLGAITAVTNGFTGIWSFSGNKYVYTFNNGEISLPTGSIRIASLTDGYIPYHVSDSSGLANSAIYQTASGGIIIGGTTSVNKFEVVGTVGNVFIAASGAQLSFTRNASNYIWATTALGDLQFGTNGTATSSTNSLLWLKNDNNVVLNYIGGNTGIGTGATTAAAKLEVVGATLISDNITDATIKVMRLGVRHYTNAQLPFFAYLATTESTGNTVSIGGGTSGGNAATSIKFYIAANNTTPTGTLVGSINNSGNWGFGQAAGTEKLEVTGSIYSTVSYKLKGSGTGVTTISSANASATNYTLSLPARTGTLALETIIDDAAAASSVNVGKLRYRVSGNNSYTDISMQIGASSYEWVNIVTQSW